jgi:hypothetical protein
MLWFISTMFLVSSDAPPSFDIIGELMRQHVGFECIVTLTTLGTTASVDVTHKLKEGILRDMFYNAVGNASLDGYWSRDAFQDRLRNEILRLRDQGKFFKSFSKELDDILASELYFGTLYALDEIEGKSPADPYRNANFSFRLMEIHGDRDPTTFHLLLVKAGGWHFYYVFTEHPERIFQPKFQTKRWGYLHEVDHETLGFRFSCLASSSTFEVFQNNGSYFLKDDLGSVESLHRSEKNPAFSPEAMKRQLDLRNVPWD